MKFRVRIEQTSHFYIDVEATTPEEAVEKATHAPESDHKKCVGAGNESATFHCEGEAPQSLEPANILKVVDFACQTIKQPTIDFLDTNWKVYEDQVLNEDIYDIDKFFETASPDEVQSQLQAMSDCAVQHDCAYVRIIYT